MAADQCLQRLGQITSRLTGAAANRRKRGQLAPTAAARLVADLNVIGAEIPVTAVSAETACQLLGLIGATRLDGPPLEPVLRTLCRVTLHEPGTLTPGERAAGVSAALPALPDADISRRMLDIAQRHVDSLTAPQLARIAAGLTRTCQQMDSVLELMKLWFRSQAASLWGRGSRKALLMGDAAAMARAVGSVAVWCKDGRARDPERVALAALYCANILLRLAEQRSAELLPQRVCDFLDASTAAGMLRAVSQTKTVEEWSRRLSDTVQQLMARLVALTADSNAPLRQAFCLRSVSRCLRSLHGCCRRHASLRRREDAMVGLMDNLLKRALELARDAREGSETAMQLCVCAVAFGGVTAFGLRLGRVQFRVLLEALVRSVGATFERCPPAKNLSKPPTILVAMRFPSRDTSVGDVLAYAAHGASMQEERCSIETEVVFTLVELCSRNRGLTVSGARFALLALMRTRQTREDVVRRLTQAVWDASVDGVDAVDVLLPLLALGHSSVLPPEDSPFAVAAMAAISEGRLGPRTAAQLALVVPKAGLWGICAGHIWRHALEVAHPADVARLLIEYRGSAPVTAGQLAAIAAQRTEDLLRSDGNGLIGLCISAVMSDEPVGTEAVELLTSWLRATRCTTGDLRIFSLLSAVAELPAPLSKHWRDPSRRRLSRIAALVAACSSQVAQALQRSEGGLGLRRSMCLAAVFACAAAAKPAEWAGGLPRLVLRTLARQAATTVANDGVQGTHGRDLARLVESLAHANVDDAETLDRICSVLLPADDDGERLSTCFTTEELVSLLWSFSVLVTDTRAPAPTARFLRSAAQLVCEGGSGLSAPLQAVAKHSLSVLKLRECASVFSHVAAELRL
eukprot:TRINITY_DN21764_c0_g1_i2.p1 TRINITY_DN21764_c0_g1~~TRINITY_DN21764_c0_g1_i2.p1  ORF type:complete len:860 (+),score=151.92 TRINITY_DN21764_c0_g1_i2:41-2620(+)